MFIRHFVTSGVKINSYTKILRTLHNKSAHTCEITDINIPVPWGKVAGKLWGSQDKQPILAMHGWQDNAASFDALAPLLTKKLPVLAIDLPGHGFSSWLPSGFMYNELIYFLLIKRIMMHFKWKKIKILAHSLSTMTTYWYASIFPMDLQYVIALDFYKFPNVEVPAFNAFFHNSVNAFFKLEKSHDQPSYSKDEILKKWSGGLTQLSNKELEILMTRSITLKEDGTYIINRDPRIRVAPVHSHFVREHQEEFAKLIKCPYLVLKGKESPYIEKREVYHNTLQIMKTHNNDVNYEEVPGAHHFHLTHPEPAAAIINTFLEKYDTDKDTN